MSDFRKITDEVSVSPQICVADLEQAAHEGFKTVICNRPDGEAFDQIECSVIAEAAKKLGMSWYFIPLSGGHLSMELIDDMAKAMAEAEGPILAYCNSGTRSCHLWALGCAMNGTMDPESLIEHGLNTGYNLSGISGILHQLYQGSKA